MGKKLMVVAHPDDEVIFGGAHLLREKGWKVVCVTNAYNKARAAEFTKVMKRIGADYEIWNYKDTYSHRFDRVGLRRDLKRLVQTVHFDKIVTHGVQGEYGHPQHKVIGKIMREIVKSNLYTFSVGKRRLHPKILKRKRQLLKLYRTQRKTIWELRRDTQLDNYIEREHLVQVKQNKASRRRNPQQQSTHGYLSSGLWGSSAVKPLDKGVMKNEKPEKYSDSAPPLESKRSVGITEEGMPTHPFRSEANSKPERTFWEFW